MFLFIYGRNTIHKYIKIKIIPIYKKNTSEAKKIAISLCENQGERKKWFDKPKVKNINFSILEKLNIKNKS